MDSGGNADDGDCGISNGGFVDVAVGGGGDRLMPMMTMMMMMIIMLTDNK